ncbi:hypothetical protein J2X02_001328 [Pseudoxanthomonas japonensis]|uniref:hypothetical protein n=1 Tax=Pseudoxanthomonas TaxID=83618 RepID=UPI000781BCCA|nr:MULTISPECIES: hypothetical protein [Pseudoxanthomonas]MDR7068511.1 hypothetical protein [Pseudoxanthomonas japonensis]
MQKTRDSHWIRRNTTIDDLLDDGVENDSDVNIFSEGAPPQTGPAADVIQQRRIAYTDEQRVRAASSAHRAMRGSRSFWGAATGGACIFVGTLLILYPVAMWVSHPGMKLAWPVMEWVSREGSILYGAVLVLFGGALAAFSLFVPRSPP